MKALRGSLFRRLWLGGALLWALVWSAQVHASELLVVKPGQAPILTLPNVSGSSGAWGGFLTNLPSSAVKSGLLFSAPIDLSSIGCNGGPIGIFSIKGDETESDIKADDPRGVTELTVFYATQTNTLDIKVTARPLVEARRASSSITYTFKVMDNFFLNGNFCASSRDTSVYTFNIYFNQYNMVIEAVPHGMGEVYVTPINLGVGDFIWDQMLNNPTDVFVWGKFSANSSMPVLAGNLNAKIYSIYWTPDAADARSAEFNVKDSLNFYYGAKAYPVRSPTLTKTRAAAAIMDALAQ